jgi:hypothetical protein
MVTSGRSIFVRSHAGPVTCQAPARGAWMRRSGQGLAWKFDRRGRARTAGGRLLALRGHHAHGMVALHACATPCHLISLDSRFPPVQQCNTGRQYKGGVSVNKCGFGAYRWLTKPQPSRASAGRRTRPADFVLNTGESAGDRTDAFNGGVLGVLGRRWPVGMPPGTWRSRGTQSILEWGGM